MTRTHRTFRAGLFLSLLLSTAGSSAETKVDLGGSGELISGDFNVGGRAVSVTGSKDKAAEYADFRNGFMVDEARLRMESETKPYYLDLRLRNATRDDESYRVKSGVHGKWSFDASFDRTPHNFNTGALILNGAGSGRLGIANAVQSSLQAVEQTRQERGGVALTDTTGEDAQAQAIVRNLLSTSDPTTFKLERERASVNMACNVTPEVKTWVKAAQERRDGDRQTAAGTYERYAQGAAGLTHTEDQFVVTGMELAEPVNYRTTTFNAGAGVYKKSWLADVEYTLTDFDNGIKSLAWSNPFRTTDLGAKSATGADNNAYDRGRFVNGQMSLAPSNQTHDLSLSGSVELPLHSRFTGNASYALTSQNDLLLPYTLNSGIAGIGGAPANVTDVAALPASRFNGEIRTLTQSYAFTTKPTEKLGASVKYRYYDYSNHSDSILFPGYAAFGESYWRTFRNDPTGANDAVVRNDPASYTRQTAKFAVDYEVARPLTVDVDALWDRYDFKQQRIDKTDEVGAGAGFVLRPAAAADVKGSYHYAHRAVKNYKRGDTAANPEAIGLMNYNWADRVRHRADLRADVTPVDSVTFGVGGRYQNDEYGADDRFGLKSQKNLIGMIDATYEPSENVAVSASYSRENRKGRMQSAAKDDTFNVAGSALDDSFGSDNFNPFNYWNTDITENVDTIGLDVAVRPVPEKLKMSLGYAFSESRMRFDTGNPNAADASAAGYSGTKLANGAAKAWPAVVSRTQEIRAGGSYEVMKDLTVGLNYLFAWYRLNDFTNSSSYLAGSTPENSTKYVMTGGTNYDYTAHMVGSYVAYKF
ncbi:MAG: MtrB/PioB family decaheme-associated outer membrane protein [Elusimicrobia bacterium]|nr:MtrB/PioB family decaheme-associated outer membrane protein [Elusimicrobiota bacterium]